MSDIHLNQQNRPHIRYTSKDYDSLLQDLVELAKKRLPEWTDHSSSDPGMVLLESFAYLADVMLYYQDRISQECFPHTAVEKRNVKSLLRLIGYEFKGAFPARTILKKNLILEKITQPKIKIQIESGMQFFATGIEDVDQVMFLFHPGIERLFFSEFLPGCSYEFFTFPNHNRSKILVLQEKFGPEDQIYLLSPSKLKESVPLLPQQNYSLRKAQNSNLPEENQIIIHSSFLEKLDARLHIVPLLVEHKKASAPQIEIYLPVIQAEKSVEMVRISEGTPNQQFHLKIPMVRGIQKFWAHNEISVDVTSQDRQTLVRWEQKENFLDSHPGSLHYYVQLNERDEPIVFFGDGINGATPPLGSEIRIRFLISLGEKGNIAKNLIRQGYFDSIQIEGAKAGDISVSNTTPALGGKNPESAKEAIQNAPKKLKTMERAVTKEDYEYLIKANFPEVKDVIVKRGPIYKILIYILFAEEIDNNEKAVEQSLKDIYNFLEDYRMLTVLIELRRAERLNINLKAQIHLNSQAKKDENWYKQAIYERVEQVIRDQTLSEEPIHHSKIFHAIHTIEGVNFVENLIIDYDRKKLGIPSYITVVKIPEDLRIIYSY